MKDETVSRLESVLRKKAELNQRQAERREEEEWSAKDKEQRQQAARERWAMSLKEIEAAVSKLNSRIKAAGFEFEIEERPAISPGIAQLGLLLTEEGADTDNRLVLNVGEFGTVRPVVLVPHTGQDRGAFEIERADRDFYESLLVGFLDEVIQVQQKAERKRQDAAKGWIAGRKK